MLQITEVYILRLAICILLGKKGAVGEDTNSLVVTFPFVIKRAVSKHFAGLIPSHCNHCITSGLLTGAGKSVAFVQLH